MLSCLIGAYYEVANFAIARIWYVLLIHAWLLCCIFMDVLGFYCMSLGKRSPDDQASPSLPLSAAAAAAAASASLDAGSNRALDVEPYIISPRNHCTPSGERLLISHQLITARTLTTRRPAVAEGPLEHTVS